MLILAHRYKFYELTETERKKLVGKVFTEPDREYLFFPVQLTANEFNYGKQQGLVFITALRYVKGEKWFRVGALSPDDLDCDLDFQGKECACRQDVITYMRGMNKRNVTYRGVLQTIQKHFNAGTITS